MWATFNFSWVLNLVLPLVGSHNDRATQRIECEFVPNHCGCGTRIDAEGWHTDRMNHEVVAMGLIVLRGSSPHEIEPATVIANVETSRQRGMTGTSTGFKLIDIRRNIDHSSMPESRYDQRIGIETRDYERLSTFGNSAPQQVRRGVAVGIDLRQV